jgi:hypothetical protein
VSREYTPDAIMTFAHSICYAASPPFPDLAPDAPLEEQAQQVTDWDIDSRYEDAHIKIYIGGAQSAGGRKEGCEVYIGLSNVPVSDEGPDNTTVFVGYELFDRDADPGTAEGEVRVDIFKPGPWVDHLVALARRALPIVERRLRDTGAL